jgi:hypothetical protein
VVASSGNLHTTNHDFDIGQSAFAEFNVELAGFTVTDPLGAQPRGCVSGSDQLNGTFRVFNANCPPQVCRNLRCYRVVDNVHVSLLEAWDICAPPASESRDSCGPGAVGTWGGPLRHG